MVGLLVVALATVTRVNADRDGLGDTVVLGTGAVAMLALDIGLRLQLKGHGIPVAGLQNAREGPSHVLRHTGEITIVRFRGMAAKDVAVHAVGPVMAALDTVDGFLEEGGVTGVHIGCNLAVRIPLVTEGALRVVRAFPGHVIDHASANVFGPGDIGMHDDHTVTGGHADLHGVGSHHIGNEHHPVRYLEVLAPSDRVDGHVHRDR